MPLRPFYRDSVWLLPPSLDDLIPDDHAARFVAAFVDGLDRGNWLEMGVEADGDELGFPAYHPQVLLGVWLYGFLTGVRSARKLEGACRDQLPYLWLTGWQHPVIIPFGGFIRPIARVCVSCLSARLRPLCGWDWLT